MTSQPIRCSSPATYTWSATKRRLTFAVVEDTCSLRVSLLDGGAWTRVR